MSRDVALDRDAPPLTAAELGTVAATLAEVAAALEHGAAGFPCLCDLPGDAICVPVEDPEALADVRPASLCSTGRAYWHAFMLRQALEEMSEPFEEGRCR